MMVHHSPHMKGSRKVVITGVSRGLGLAMVGEFAALGWTVAGCCRDAAAVARLSTSHGVPHYFQQADVTDEAAVASFCAELLERQGPPDLVLNNAAIVNRNAPLWEVSAEEFSAVIDANIKGTAAMIRHLAPAMLRRGSGVIVNFSSGWGRSTSPEVAPYCATKWAIEGLSQAMSQETGGKVAVVALNPGIIDTQMLRSCFGPSAADFPDAPRWAKKAVPFLAALGPKDNGRALTAPN
jgi:NAD(P)-dependent dehydrogenase (short-subunit alcohol dehydrogenase family)